MHHSPRENPLEVTSEPAEEVAESRHDEDEEERADVVPTRPQLLPKRRRRLSMYESADGGQDLEHEEIGGSARPVSFMPSSRRSLSLAGSGQA